MSSEQDKPWLSITEKIAEKLREGDLDGALELDEQRRAQNASIPLRDRLPIKDPVIILAAELAGIKLPPERKGPKK